MRFYAPLFAALAAFASAQSSNGTSTKPNAIAITDGSLKISAGSNTIKWSNPTSGNVIIKLQVFGSTITPSSGLVVVPSVSSSAQTATFNVNAGDVNPNVQYVVEIIDATDPNTYNFSNQFSISGATGTATGFASSSTASQTSTSTASSSSSSGSSSSSSSSSASSTSSSSSSGTTITTTSSSTSSRATEAAPTSMGAGSIMGINGGFAMFVAGAVMAL